MTMDTPPPDDLDGVDGTVPGQRGEPEPAGPAGVHPAIAPGSAEPGAPPGRTPPAGTTERQPAPRTGTAADATRAKAAPATQGGTDREEPGTQGGTDREEPGTQSGTDGGEPATRAAMDGEAPVAATRRRRRGRIRPLRRLQRFVAFLIRSRRGLLLLFLLLGGGGAMVTLGGIVAADYSESPAFCGQCHTMDPEVKAYKASAHREVTCAECHINPGLAGMIKAKAKGTQQLVEVLTGTYPKPIEPPDHGELPPVKNTCLRCHSLEGITKNEGPVGLVLRPTYQTDEKNTRELIAVVLRPVGLGGNDGVQGVHWHVQQTVTYTAADPQARTIGLVEVKKADGTVDQYIGTENITISSDVAPDIARLKANDRVRTMDCLDCHNRVGHAVPSIDQALDNAIAAGRISQDLPYIKKAGAALLEANYPSVEAADKAMDGLRDTYGRQYPQSVRDETNIDRAIAELKKIYRQLATPQMKVQAKTYPDNLGHQEGTGCFRCHDGAHYQVINGKVSTKTIPSTCSTCHTFPQIGGSISVVPLAGQPPTHNERLYVFTHKLASTSVEPAGQSCGTCHDRSYCQNCHSSGAVKITHDAMLYNHAAVIRRVGGQACAYCHQAVYCSSCHTGPVLQTKGQGG